jgi:hypothetical protein
MRTATWSYIVGAAMLIAVTAPLTGLATADSFPVSDYPMFSFKRDTPVASIAHAVGVTAAGDRTTLPPRAVGTDEVIQAFETFRQAVRNGDAALAALCQDIAARVAADGYATIEITSDTFDAIEYLDGARTPDSTVIHASCPVLPS